MICTYLYTTRTFKVTPLLILYCCFTVGEDFAITGANPLFFSEGSPANTRACTTISIFEDQEMEGNEIFSLQLQSDQAAIEQGRGILEFTIIDGNPL